MRLRIFDVEHGACALVICDDGRSIMIDCGHNATTGWLPGDHLNSIGIRTLAALLVTNYDEDHVSGVRNLFDRVWVQTFFGNTAVSPGLIRELKTEDGMGLGIRFLVSRLKSAFSSGPSVAPADLRLPDLEFETFSLSPREFDDENNLSMVVSLRCQNMWFLFPGDLERSGWLRLLDRPQFRSALMRTQVLIASHHGRVSGWCEEVFDYCTPRFVIISDKKKGYQTQETTDWYAAIASGDSFDGNPNRKVITTRCDGSLEFEFIGSHSFTFRKLATQPKPILLRI